MTTLSWGEGAVVPWGAVKERVNDKRCTFTQPFDNSLRFYTAKYNILTIRFCSKKAEFEAKKAKEKLSTIEGENEV